MATFITTIKFTEKGIEGIRETGKRAAAFKAAAKKMGVKVTGIYWTLASVRWRHYLRRSRRRNGDGCHAEPVGPRQCYHDDRPSVWNGRDREGRRNAGVVRGMGGQVSRRLGHGDRP